MGCGAVLALQCGAVLAPLSISEIDWKGSWISGSKKRVMTDRPGTVFTQYRMARIDGCG
jgi:hypothetical protein